jgi:hypothetical protein
VEWADLFRRPRRALRFGLFAYLETDLPALALPEETLIDQVLAGERVSPEEARALYELPLDQLGDWRIAGEARRVPGRVT